jgi:hypothetical protein
MSQDPTPGRPPLPDGVAASAFLHLRVNPGRKAKYVRAANQRRLTLAAWCLEHLDNAAAAAEPVGGDPGGAKTPTAQPPSKS